MLGKLIKYEVKATKRFFLPLYGLILLFAALNKLFAYLNLQRSQNFLPNFVSGISLALYVFLIAAVFILTLVVTVQRFYKNLLGDEGYLSFTLPVKIHSHIDSKMIVSLIWTALSVVVSVLSIIILGFDRNLIRILGSAFGSLGEFSSRYGAAGWGVVASALLLLLVIQLCGILAVYASIVVGNLSGKHKQLAGFGAFLGISIVMQIAFFSIFNGNVFQSFERRANETAQLGAVQYDLWVVILFFAAFSAVFYFFTNWMLSEKLNLE